MGAEKSRIVRDGIKMKPLAWNLLKVVAGYVAGLPLLCLIYPLPIWAIALFQLLFYTLFYTILDKLKEVKQK